MERIHPKAALDAVTELKESLGWALVKELLDGDFKLAVSALGDNPNMSEGELHYRRGRIAASTAFLELPDKLIMKYSNDLIMHEHTKPEED